LEQLIALGFRRVLTSGQQENAYNGAALIAELVRRAAGRIEILPAGGVNCFTAADILTRTGCDQVHASLRQPRLDPSTRSRPDISFGPGIKSPEGRYDATSAMAADARRRKGRKRPSVPSRAPGCAQRSGDEDERPHGARAAGSGSGNSWTRCPSLWQ